VAHWGEWHRVVYGVSLHLYGLMMVLFAGRDLVRIAQVDYAAPVLEIQKHMVALRAQRIRAGSAFAIAGCFAWVPLVLVVFDGLGADLWIHKPEMIARIVASDLGAVLFTWALVAWSRLARNAKLRKDLDDHAAGRSLTRAQAALEEIARFEQD
jgi:hypothetical protein